MVTVILCAGLAVALALLVAILLKVATLPGALRAQARRDRAEGRAEGQAEAFTALQEAAAAKVGGIVVAIQAYEERSASLVRDELAASEVRARVSERRAADTMPLLGAPSHGADAALDAAGHGSRGLSFTKGPRDARDEGSER